MQVAPLRLDGSCAGWCARRVTTTNRAGHQVALLRAAALGDPEERGHQGLGRWVRMGVEVLPGVLD